MDTQQSPKIPFYALRSFGERLNASFDFIKENWKVVLKYATYLILPVCLIQALSMNSFVGQYMGIAMSDLGNPGLEDFGAAFFLGYGVMMLCMMVGSLLMTSLIYALIKLYHDREDRLNGITFADIRPLLFRNIGRLIVLGLVLTGFLVLAMFVMILLGVFTAFTLIFTIPAFVAVMIALSIWPPIYLYEKIGVGASFAKAFRMGFATWGSMFGVMFIMGSVASILQGVTTMPWYMTVVVRNLFAYSTEGTVTGDTGFIYNIFVYILGVMQSYGTYLSMIFGLLGISYQYAYASEKLDSVTVESEIDNFENL